MNDLPVKRRACWMLVNQLAPTNDGAVRVKQEQLIAPAHQHGFERDEQLATSRPLQRFDSLFIGDFVFDQGLAGVRNDQQPLLTVREARPVEAQRRTRQLHPLVLVSDHLASGEIDHLKQAIS
ncbi:MAG: hypothetical protein Q8N26_33330 [Myxococcales bacterium]|nr:hypothetical protein [Myxococcales bacterium]